MTTLILGAGLMGTTTAWYLSQAGEDVVVVDRQSEAGVETSFANGGLVTPSMSDPWGSPGLPVKLIKWLGSEDAPFLLRAKAIPGLMNWGLRFLANCTEAKWRSNAGVVHRIADYSTNALSELTASTGLEYDRSTLGNLRVFRDEPSMEAALKTAALMAEFGVRHEQLSASASVDLEPALATVSTQLMGGITYPDDDSGDAFKFTQNLARLCEQRGVTFKLDTAIANIESDGDQITGIETKNGARLLADRYVLALGSYSPLMAKPLGIRLPVYPVKGYSLTIPSEGMDKPPRIPVVDDGQKLGVTPLGDRLRAAGTAEFNGYETAPSAVRSELLVTALKGLYPHVSIPDNTQTWCGLRPVTPDGPPILGRTRFANLFLNCGQGHLGWTMSCGSARIVTDIITGRTPDIDMTGLTLDRF